MSRTRTTLAVSALLVVAATLAITACSPQVQRVVETIAPSLSQPPASQPIGVDDGFVEVGGAIDPFADELPAIAKLEPNLRAAMQDAARDAISDGVEFVVTSGWRSKRYQQSLLDAAILRYGSEQAAGEFVSSPEDSKHVTGEAVDIGRTDANSWLSQHGTDYGLCQIYANEMWHFELATEPGGVCPEQLSHAGVR